MSSSNFPCGIQFAQTPEETEELTGKLLGSEPKNLKVERNLLEKGFLGEY